MAARICEGRGVGLELGGGIPVGEQAEVDDCLPVTCQSTGGGFGKGRPYVFFLPLVDFHIVRQLPRLDRELVVDLIKHGFDHVTEKRELAVRPVRRAHHRSPIP